MKVKLEFIRRRIFNIVINKMREVGGGRKEDSRRRRTLSEAQGKSGHWLQRELAYTDLMIAMGKVWCL